MAVRHKKEGLNSFEQIQVGYEQLVQTSQTLRKSMQPIEEMGKQINRQLAQIQKISLQYSELIQQITNNIQATAHFANALRNINIPIQSVVSRLIEQARTMNTLDQIGWLPHMSLPQEIVTEEADNRETILRRLLSYYEDHWLEVRKGIETSMITWQINEQAKEGFREALEAHEARHYRCVCCLLFIEIERASRIELYDNNFQPIASQLDLRDAVKFMPSLATKEIGFLGINLAECFCNHVYMKVKDKETLDQLAMNPIPNRHVAIHGRVAYTSRQNSLNAIFIADYAFKLINLMKDFRQTEITQGEEA